jgi:ApaLI-like restriction endonuclease
MARDKRLTLEQSQLISRVRTMGTATMIPIFLEDSELVKLTAIILNDIGRTELIPSNIQLPADTNYYNLPIEWFTQKLEGVDFIPVFLNSLQNIPDFDTYLKCLCEIHKRRRKYEKILSAQPLPKMAQISPRALLEYGIISSNALASWMKWRKWFYDIDNRAAQETGYLFEPILASVLGGIPYGAQNSPIRRRNNPKRGRQVDCIVDKTAYEFKLRVTIAASGQGRFAEELDFAEDCKESNFNPVLLVLDPTPSSRLQELSREYTRVGGEAYIGDEAWLHLEEQAGETMTRFVEKYVRQPIAEVSTVADDLLNLSISNVPDDSSFKIELSNEQSSYIWNISRHEDEVLGDVSEDEL